MNKSVELSVIIPLLNEEANIRELYSILKSTIKQLALSYEIIFIDDGSIDSSFNVIQQLHTIDSNVNGISLSRNFGHQVALIAGIDYAQGNLIVMMDADLQHPPEIIKDLIDKYKEGYDIVNTRRIDTGKLGWLKKSTSVFFYKLINTMSDTRIEPASSDFRLMSRKAVDAFKKMREQDRFTRGLVSWMGFKQTFVNYNAPSRYQGKSKYTTRRMLRFALDGITSFSSKPLRLSIIFGFIVFLCGLIYSVFALINYFKGHTVPGWTSQLISILILGGIQLVSIGILGEYIARIFKESKDRPIYLIKDFIGEVDKTT